LRAVTSEGLDLDANRQINQFLPQVGRPTLFTDVIARLVTLDSNESRKNAVEPTYKNSLEQLPLQE
jgi:hypothetical protein